MPKFYKLDYRLLNPLGEEVDSSAGGNPMAFVEGDGTMVPGLEAAVLGKLAGDEFEVKIGPEKAYGFPSAHWSELWRRICLWRTSTASRSV